SKFQDALRSPTCWTHTVGKCLGTVRVQKATDDHDGAKGGEGRSAGTISSQGFSDSWFGRRTIRISADPDDRAMVARPRLQPRVRRTSVRWLRTLSAEAPAAAGSASAKQPGPAGDGWGNWTFARRVAWRGIVRRSFLVTLLARWDASLFRWLEDAARRGVSAGFSRAGDSAAGNHLQPSDIPTPALGVATFFERARVTWSS